MDEAREGKDEKNRQSQEKMRLEYRMRVGDEVRRSRPERQDPLRPVHEFHHLMPVEMLQRDENRREAKEKLGEEDQKDGRVAEARRLADPRIEQPAMNQEEDADKACEPREAADDDREQLLGPVRNPDGVENPDRGQKADEMPEEDDEDADMKEDAPEDELAAAQQLA